MKYAALVIALNEYDNNTHLINALNDGVAMASKFKELKYDVIELLGEKAVYSEYVNAVSELMSKSYTEKYDAVSEDLSRLNDSFQSLLDASYFSTLQSSPMLAAHSVNKVLPHLAANTAVPLTIFRTGYRHQYCYFLCSQPYWFPRFLRFCFILFKHQIS